MTLLVSNAGETVLYLMPYFIVLYVVIGAIVAFVYTKQQQMAQEFNSYQSLNQSVSVLLILALMWPVLLPAMLLNHYQAKHSKFKKTQTKKYKEEKEL